MKRFADFRGAGVNLLKPNQLIPTQLLTAVSVNTAIACYLSKSSSRLLTSSGLTHASLLGIGLWALGGLEAWLLCGIYFILGTAVTHVGYSKKLLKGIAEKRGGERGPENVWGSGAVGLLCIVAMKLVPKNYERLFLLGYVASLATKLADTASSEIGKAYGKTTVLITNAALVPPGTEGAVSLEGTAAGVAASILFGGVACGLHLLESPRDVAVCAAAAFLANIAESVVGATLQGRISFMTNEVVNVINTAIGAGLAMLFRMAVEAVERR